jgi:hypothetical protein
MENFCIFSSIIRIVGKIHQKNYAKRVQLSEEIFPSSENIKEKSPKNREKFFKHNKVFKKVIFLHALELQISDEMDRCRGERINQHLGRVCVSTDTWPR